MTDAASASAPTPVPAPDEPALAGAASASASATPASVDELLCAIGAAYDDARYPEGFLEDFAIVECLAERPGIDTFLVRDAEGTEYVAKCFDTSVWSITGGDDILGTLDHQGLPKSVAAYEGAHMRIAVREFIEGVPLDRYARENDLNEQDIVDICVQLCDILAYLHHRPDPVIHRDIKPQNIIVRPDGRIALIDFDIARVWREGSDTDTLFFGTLAYAPPEQYGFAQTDARADIYSLGILLRYLLTGSPRENRNVRFYRPLEKIVRTCTAFSPKERFSDVDQVKKALLRANPKTQGLYRALIVIAAAIVVGLIVFAGIKAYEAATYSPFSAEDHIPAMLNDEERVADAVAYMKQEYGTDLFDNPDDLATAGLLRRVLTDVYGLDHDYVYASQTEGLPGESDDWFMAWGWDDEQNMDRDYTVYAAVKVHDPSIVAEDQWSKLKDDTGEYPGARVAMMFAEETGMLAGVGRPYDITVGEMALIFANADRVFDASSPAGN